MTSAASGAAPQARLTLQARQFQLLGRIDRRIVTSGDIDLALGADALKASGQLTVDEGLIDISNGNAPTLDSDVDIVDPNAPAVLLVSGGTTGLCVGHVAPEAVDGGPIALVRDGDAIRLDVGRGRLDLLVDDDELASRAAEFTPLPPRYTRGVLAKYSKLVTSASQGAVCR